MQHITTFTGLIDCLRQSGIRRRVAVVCPYDEETLHAALRARTEAIADLVFFGDSRILSLMPDDAPAEGAGSIEAVVADTDAEAVRMAVDAVRKGEADVLMKGLVNTDTLLKAVLDKEKGLHPAGAVLSHLTVAHIPAYRKLLFFSDVAVIPYPTIEQREAVIGYDLAICRRMGIARPKVALIHFTEKVNPKFPNSTDYARLCEMAREGRFGEVDMAGPMDVKTACDAHSAAVKGIESDVCGDADILIFPNIESGNTFYKTITVFAGACVAGMLTGTSAPVILSSRSDSAESKFLSIALACVNA